VRQYGFPDSERHTIPAQTGGRVDEYLAGTAIGRVPQRARLLRASGFRSVTSRTSTNMGRSLSSDGGRTARFNHRRCPRIVLIAPDWTDKIGEGIQDRSFDIKEVLERIDLFDVVAQEVGTADVDKQEYQGGPVDWRRATSSDC
jgi:hypothetical protein